jgi:hypothetical protein
LTQAAQAIAEVNRIRPTVASLLIAARAEKKQNRHREAIAFYQQAIAILRGQETGCLSDLKLQTPNLVPAQAGIRTMNSIEQPEETLVWT